MTSPVSFVSECCAQNPLQRDSQEDAHGVITQFREGVDHKDMLFQLFDGHGGRGTVDFVSSALAFNLKKCLDREDAAEDMERALRASFLLTDIQTRKHVSDASGATAVCCVLRTFPNNQHKLYCANVGDSRAVLFRDGAPVRLTYDHKAEDKAEQDRVAELGGFTMRNRILGVLAVSRSFGDHAFKTFVTAEPHLVSMSVCNKDEHTDEFLLICCDGVFDVLTDEEAVDIVKSAVAKEGPTQAVTKCLVDEAIRRGSSDNLTAMVIFLEGNAGN